MGKAKVYFSDLRALPGTSLPEKLKKLIRRAGIGEIDFEKKMTAIKIHFENREIYPTCGRTGRKPWRTS